MYLVTKNRLSIFIYYLTACWKCFFAILARLRHAEIPASMRVRYVH